MLTYVNGNLFQSPARVLVNTVNVVGVMGKGIAKDFKFYFPEMFREYQLRCENKTLDIGKLYLYRGQHKWVLNFPTKKHWRQPSKAEYIEAGLKSFVGGYAKHGITSIAFPRLGCGNGELDWESVVRPLMEKYLARLPIDIYIHHYEGGVSPPEHQDVEAVKAWLRSEPESLGFSEVWDDLLDLLRTKATFTASDDGQQFSVQVVDNPEEGLLLVGEQSRFVPKESLLETWQCLRSAGFLTTGNFVDGLDRCAGQVMALLSALPYVRLAHIAQPKPGKLAEYKLALQFVPRVGAGGTTSASDLPQATPL